MTIFDEAERLITGARMDDYGHPNDAWDRVALAWSGVLGVPVSSEQAQLMMAAMKIVRQAIRPKRDNLTDGAAYLRLVEMGSDGGEETEG